MDIRKDVPLRSPRSLVTRYRLIGLCLWASSGDGDRHGRYARNMNLETALDVVVLEGVSQGYMTPKTGLVRSSCLDRQSERLGEGGSCSYSEACRALHARGHIP